MTSCVDKLCVNKLCGEKLWAAGGKREAGGQRGRSQPETRTPHKDVGNKKNVVVVFSIASLLNPGSGGITEEAFTLDPISD